LKKLPQPQGVAGQPTHYENTQLYFLVKPCCAVEKEFALLVGENSFLSLLISLCFLPFGAAFFLFVCSSLKTNQRRTNAKNSTQRKHNFRKKIFQNIYKWLIISW